MTVFLKVFDKLFYNVKVDRLCTFGSLGTYWCLKFAKLLESQKSNYSILPVLKLKKKKKPKLST